MVLARLAVSRTHQGKGIARAMVQDALVRALAAAGLAGIHAIVVHANDGRAAGSGEGLRFTRMPGAPLVPYCSLRDACASLEPPPAFSRTFLCRPMRHRGACVGGFFLADKADREVLALLASTDASAIASSRTSRAERRAPDRAGRRFTAPRGVPGHKSSCACRPGVSHDTRAAWHTQLNAAAELHVDIRTRTPFVLTMVLMVAALIAMPDIALFLPSLLQQWRQIR